MAGFLSGKISHVIGILAQEVVVLRYGNTGCGVSSLGTQNPIYLVLLHTLMWSVSEDF